MNVSVISFVIDSAQMKTYVDERTGVTNNTYTGYRILIGVLLQNPS